MGKITHLLSLGALLFLAPSAESQTPVTTGLILKFEDLRPDAQTVPAYISFGGAGALTATNLADNSPISKTASYKLSDLSAGILITQISSGRIFIALGTPLTTSNAGNGYSPNYANPNLADFATRWDKVELDFNPGPHGNAGGANLSSQDFFGLPLKISTTGGGQSPSNLTWRINTVDAFQYLAQLANFAISTPQDATGAIGLGNNGVFVPGVIGGNVVRLISPGSVAPKAGNTTPYPGLANYVNYLKTGNKTTPGQPIKTIIAGHNGQLYNGGPFQTYNLSATISNSSYTIIGGTVNPGDLLMTGTVNSGGGDVTTTILIRASELTDYKIFGANPAFTLVQGANTNSIVQKVIADYFSALNFGLAGSTVDNPAMPGTAIGDSPSWTWYGNKPDGSPQPKLPITDAFGFAQRSNKYYNQYASYLTGVSDTYGFAYNDRLQSPLAALGDGSIMTVSILADTQLTSEGDPQPITIMNGASYLPNGRVAPGSIAVVTGNIPAAAETVAPGVGVPLPQTLAGVQVQFNGTQNAPLFAVTPEAAVIQIPWELADETDNSIVVSGSAGAGSPQSVKLARFAPGIFAVNEQGTGQGSIYDTANNLVDSSNPAAVGSEIVIYCTGLGPVFQPPATGTPTPSQPVSRTLAEPMVTVGGVPAQVVSSALAPGFVGLYQVSILIPQDSPHGPEIPVLIQVGAAISNIVTMAVR